MVINVTVLMTIRLQLCRSSFGGRRAGVSVYTDFRHQRAHAGTMETPRNIRGPIQALSVVSAETRRTKGKVCLQDQVLYPGSICVRA